MTRSAAQRVTLTRDVDRGVVQEGSRPLELTNVITPSGTFTELVGLDIRPIYRGCLILAQASIADDSNWPTVFAGYYYAFVDLRVLGWVSAMPHVLYAGGLGGEADSLALKLDGLDAYTRLTVHARRSIDGGGGDSVFFSNNGPKINVSALLRFNRT